MLGILLGLVVLMALAYLGWSIIWIAPIAAGVVALTGGLDLLNAYTDTYMGGFVSFAKDWFPVFMLGAVFGKLMEDTGMARSVAVALTKVIGTKRAILGVLASAAVLTYGGVSLFVVVFAVYPLALSLFREANISRKLIPATVALGSFTFTMTAIPGTPQIQNLIPMEYFKTTPTAAPIMGIAGALVMAVGGYFYLRWREKQLTEKGEVFTEPKDNKITEDEVKAPPVYFIDFTIADCITDFKFIKMGCCHCSDIRNCLDYAFEHYEIQTLCSVDQQWGKRFSYCHYKYQCSRRIWYGR